MPPSSISGQRGGSYTLKTTQQVSHPSKVREAANDFFEFLGDAVGISPEIPEMSLYSSLVGSGQSVLGGMDCRSPQHLASGTSKLVSGLGAMADLSGLDLLGNTLQLTAAAREGKFWDVCQNLASVCGNPMVVGALTLAHPMAGAVAAVASNANLFLFAAKYAKPTCKMLSEVHRERQLSPQCYDFNIYQPRHSSRERP